MIGVDKAIVQADSTRSMIVALIEKLKVHLTYACHLKYVAEAYAERLDAVLVTRHAAVVDKIGRDDENEAYKRLYTRGYDERQTAIENNIGVKGDTAFPSAFD